MNVLRNYAATGIRSRSWFSRRAAASTIGSRVCALARTTISSSPLHSRNWSRGCRPYAPARRIARSFAVDRQSGLRHRKSPDFRGRPAGIVSARESAVLELLMRRQGRVVTKKAVEDQIFGMSSDMASNAVEVYVSRLRKHLTECHALIADSYDPRRRLHDC